MSQASVRGRGWRGGGGRGRGRWNGGRGSWRGNAGRGGAWRGRGRGQGQYNHQHQGHLNVSLPGHSQGIGGGNRPRLLQNATQASGPYKGWRLYFPDEDYSDFSPAVRRTQWFEKYFLSWKDMYESMDIGMKGFFTLDYKELLSDQIITEGLPDIANELSQMPEKIISCMGLAMHQLQTSKAERENQEMAEAEDAGMPPLPPANVPYIQCRILNYEPIISLKNLKANYYGKFVSVKGTVVRVSNIKPLCTRMGFECVACRALMTISLPDGKYVTPSKCASEECRSRTFNPKRGQQYTRTIDWQTIRLQEIMTDSQRESGRIPRIVDCELERDLVDSCVPGDIVTVTGIVKVTSSDEGKGQNKDKCMFRLYIHANSVNNSKGNKMNVSSGDTTSPSLALDFTMKDLYAIEEIHSDDHLLRLIVGSLCPSIYGHELVKAGLVLGLFGGSHKYMNDQNRIPVRGDPHILVVGDPGLGKSQMLQAAANVAPRSVYVCGNTTTTSGLTVTLCKDGPSGDYALEAGALVLGDQGCCCIDEFDKMGNQHQALLEAMEQQSISIAKAGIVCSLPARTSILAAANPIGGHYNKAKTVSENLKMGSALLSRFDLVFILLDKPDEEMDSMLSEHVMAMHAGRRRNNKSVSLNKDKALSESELASQRQWENDKPLSERLRMPRGEPFDPIPPQLLRKYIGYARKYVHPKIGPEAAKVIQDFYLSLRQKYHTQDSTPITTRQLESLMRLTEARTRIELREVATEQDARDVVEIMENSMIDTFSDEMGFLDFSRSSHGSGMGRASQAKKFVAILQRKYEMTFNALFTVQEMRQLAADGKLQIKDFEQFVSSLNNQGYLLKKGPRVYQLQTAGF